MVPVLPPLHKTAVNELVAVNAVGCVMVCDVVAVQPLASVMVMVYEPEVRPVKTPLDAPVVFTVGPAIT